MKLFLTHTMFSLTNSGVSEDEDGEHSNGESVNSVYRIKYERAARELEFTKRRLQTQHEHDLEQLVGLKKQLEKKVSLSFCDLSLQLDYIIFIYYYIWHCQCNELIICVHIAVNGRLRGGGGTAPGGGAMETEAPKDDERDERSADPVGGAERSQ